MGGKQNYLITLLILIKSLFFFPHQFFLREQELTVYLAFYCVQNYNLLKMCHFTTLSALLRKDLKQSIVPLIENNTDPPKTVSSSLFLRD